MLEAMAYGDNNNTNISCRAQNGNKKYSNIAVLRIQGELDHYYILKLITMFPCHCKSWLINLIKQ